MLHSDAGELHQLYATFTLVWREGRGGSLFLETVDGKVSAVLKVQFSPPSAPRPGAPEAHHQAAGCINHQPGQQRRRHHRGPGTRSCKKGNLEKAQAGPQSRASTNSTTCCSFSATGHRCQREDQKQVQLLPAGWKSWGQTDGGHCNLFTTIISSDTHISSITLLLFTIDILCSRALSYSDICCDYFKMLIVRILPCC